MEFYKITLDGMYKLLDGCNRKPYADIIARCQERWDANKDVSFFLSLFSGTGAFKDFQIELSDVSSDEELFWTRELFSALTAMAVQLARFISSGKSCDIEFMRKYFGHDSQVIYGSVCSRCGSREINAVGIDKYISTPIIAKRVVDGLENGSLNENIELIMNVSAPEIQREREHTKARIANSAIPMSQSRTAPKFCLICGNKEIKECKFLKSLKEFVFIPLSR